jgi:hypothetical protein
MMPEFFYFDMRLFLLNQSQRSKEKMKMNKIVWTCGLILSVCLVFGAADVFAGAGIEPPAGATITGPEIWGVVIIHCNVLPEVPGPPHHGAIRVKRVVDCNTETEALAGPWIGCPANLSEVEGESLQNNTSFFGIPGTAFVNKAKNFQKVGDVVSFDAQFKFWLP